MSNTNVEHRKRSAFGRATLNGTALPSARRCCIRSIDVERTRGLERPRETRVAVASTDERRSIDSRGTRRLARSPAARARARGRRDDA
jgi:hypothetical protein